MEPRSISEESIFGIARKIDSPDARDAYLAQVCGNDQALRERVASLLSAHADAASFLESPAPEFDATSAQSIAEKPGTAIGPYKLLEQIGEGGMGVVYMADQQTPVRRRVALKIIKPGMDTRQVIARFEAERQALALMDHSNIARVLDAGATDSGRPYFVMELVRGVPITEYCDKNNLPVHERLELFVQVCQAVQHAHQKGIIHRDIKPSNVLVTAVDGRPIPKVIDFGVAKAINQQLTEKTLFTNFAQMLGTPLYMSPEQAEMASVDVDTRSDIYSLGVLLYELLTGTTPFDQKRLREAALDEISRIIREEEPPKPSTRISTLANERTVTAAHRKTDPYRLSQLLRGELDWIVMKSIDKDRTRRYQTASGMARDVERYLHNEPVEACPPSSHYRLRKFVQRNKAAVAVAALVLILLTMLGGGAGWAARDRSARQGKVSGQLELILDEVARLEQVGKWSEALVSARRAEPVLATGEAPADIQQHVQQALADLELVGRLEEIRAQSGTSWSDTDQRQELAVSADRDYAAAFREAGVDVDRLSVKESAERINARSQITAAVLPALDDWVAVRSVGDNEAATRRLIEILQVADSDPWRQQMRAALIHKDWPALENLAKSPDLDRQEAATLSFLSAACRVNGKPLLEVAVLRRAQQKYPADYWINHRLGVNLIWQQAPDDVREGIGFMRAAVALRPQGGHSIMNLGNGYAALGKYDQAIACFRKAIELNPDSANSYFGLGISLEEKGLNEEAISAYEQAIKKRKPDDSSKHEALAMILSNCPEPRLRNPHRAAEMASKAVEIEPQASNNWTALGMARYRLGQWQEARMAFDKSLQLGADSWGGSLRRPDAIDWFFLAMSYWQLGQQDQARQCYDRGVQWMNGSKPWQTDDEDLRRCQTEAEELLEIIDEKLTTEPPIEVK